MGYDISQTLTRVYELCSNCIKNQRTRLQYGLRHGDARSFEYQCSFKAAEQNANEGDFTRLYVGAN